MTRSEVYILGNFGYVTNQLDGQTMESRSLLELLQMKNVKLVDYFDTQILHYKRTSAFCMFWGLLKTKRLFYMGAQDSLKYLFPIIWVLTKILELNFIFL